PDEAGGERVREARARLTRARTLPLPASLVTKRGSRAGGHVGIAAGIAIGALARLVGGADEAAHRRAGRAAEHRAFELVAIVGGDRPDGGAGQRAGGDVLVGGVLAGGEARRERHEEQELLHQGSPRLVAYHGQRGERGRVPVLSFRRREGA